MVDTPGHIRLMRCLEDLQGSAKSLPTSKADIASRQSALWPAWPPWPA